MDNYTVDFVTIDNTIVEEPRLDIMTIVGVANAETEVSPTGEG